MSERLRADVATKLRSVIQSSKEGVAVKNLLGDYRMLNGEIIPFKELGYSSLISMLMGMSDVVRLGRNKGGQEVAFAVANESTAHIQSLISKQKTAKSKPKPTHKQSRRYPQRSGSRSPSSNMFSSYIRSPYRSPLLAFPGCQQRSRASPPPQAQAKQKHAYQPPPRFQKKKEASPARVPSPVQFERPKSVTPPLSSLLSKDTKTRKSSMPVSFEPKKAASPKRVRKVTIEPLEYVSYKPSVPSFPAPKRTVSFESDFKEKIPPVKEYLPLPLVSPPNLAAAVNVTASKGHQRRSKAESSKELVDEYAVHNGIQAIYRTLQTKDKRKNVTYISTLILGDAKYISYPEEKQTAQAAEEIAASKAVKDLKIVPGQFTSKVTETPSMSYQQIKTLVEKLYEIIKSKPNGIWQTKIPAFYEKVYSETLPKDWLQILRENCANVVFDKTVEPNYIIYPGKGDECQVTPVRDHAFRRPPKLVLPEVKFIDVFVTNISEDLTVAFRLLDYADDYENLTAEMDAYYSKNNHPVTVASVGSIFAVCCDNSWFRVEVLQVVDEHAECYFLDNGDSELIRISDLNRIIPKFLHLPSQAKQCKLQGLEDHVDSGAVHQKLFDLAYGKVLVAEVVSRQHPVSLYLYDTATENDVNINEILINIAELGNLEAMTPRLPEDGKIAEGFLTHVNEDGDIYLQLSGPNLLTLENITADIGALCEDRKGSIVAPSQSKMYCAKYGNNRWYRAFVRNISPEDPHLVTVWYVDYGNEDLVRVSDLCEVDSISDILSIFPHQAVRCRLHDVPAGKSRKWTKEAVDFLFDLIPDMQNVLVKVACMGTDMSLPEVSLFKRIGPQNELVSVNETMSVEKNIFEDISKPLTSIQSGTKTPRLSQIPDVALSAHIFEEKSRNNLRQSDSTGDVGPDMLPPLSPPPIPDVGKTFDVTVILVAHPHNFTIQPWQSGEQLDDVMAEMQMFYNSEDNIFDMHEYLLKAGEFYASKHKDGRWYRATVVKIMPENTVWVYFVDFGDYNMTPANDVQPLWGRFRTLPFQAIRARLHDVEPIEGDWNPMDSVHFQEMVMDKQFVSVVRKKTFNQSSESNSLGGCELALTLIDTSSEKDVYIHSLLVERGNAKLISN